jgi:ATP-dependent Clp protease ATP-binding subunit ClpA
MATTISLPFFAFKLHFPPSVNLLIPLNDKSALCINESLSNLATKYQASLQRHVLDQGDYIHLLREWQTGEFLKNKVEVFFPASDDDLSFPDFSLEFDYYYSESENGIWGIIPVLGLECQADSLSNLEEDLAQSVRQDFLHQHRLSAIQHVASTIWFEQVELLRHELRVNVYTPRELENIVQDAREKFLPKLARRLNVDEQVAFGLEDELRQFERMLHNRSPRSVLLSGPTGSGKTTLVWELSRRLRQQGWSGGIWETTASTMIKALTLDTGWQDNLAKLCREMAAGVDILYVRSLKELFEVGRYVGNEQSMAEYLHTFLNSSELTLISECTDEEKARIELEHPTFLSSFQTLRLDILDVKKQESIIHEKVAVIAHRHKVDISRKAIDEAIALFRRFSPYSGMPGRPIRFLENLLSNASTEKRHERITRRGVIERFCQETGLPIFMVDASVPMEAPKVRKWFEAQVFGQEEATDAITQTLGAVTAALTPSGRPIASLFFVGPTGVGKTELAKALARFMFGAEERMTRIDLGQYTSPFGVMRLMGHKDYFPEGILTSAVHRDPFCVLLLDEVEKAHPIFFDLLLQILGEGRLTDSQDKLVNFCGTIIIMTSNIGSGPSQITPISIGRAARALQAERRRHFIEAARKFFRPELFNRIDSIISFNVLDAVTIRHVVAREIKAARQREGIFHRGVDLAIHDEVINYLVEKGYDAKYGARHLKRVIQKDILEPLAKRLNQEEADETLKVEVDLQNGRPRINARVDRKGIQSLLETWEHLEEADDCARLRRAIIQLFATPYYLRILSELEIMENEKSKPVSLFWENMAKQKAHTVFTKIKNETQALAEQIKTLEFNIGASVLLLHAYDSKWKSELQALKLRFIEAKTTLWAELNPESDRCHLVIYGLDLQYVFDFYRQLIVRKGYTYQLQLIKRRDKGMLYWNNKPSNRQKGGSNYDLVPASSALPPADELQAALGVEFIIDGPSSFLFFNEERGLQTWRMAENEGQSLAMVEVGKTPVDFPENIHRQEFYQRMKARRDVSPHHLRDKLYHIQQDVAAKNQVNFFVELLDKRFQAKIDLELFGDHSIN